jgi:hypothetical protein
LLDGEADGSELGDADRVGLLEIEGEAVGDVVGASVHLLLFLLPFPPLPPLPLLLLPFFELVDFLDDFFEHKLEGAGVEGAEVGLADSDGWFESEGLVLG